MRACIRVTILFLFLVLIFSMGKGICYVAPDSNDIVSLEVVSSSNSSFQFLSLENSLDSNGHSLFGGFCKKSDIYLAEKNTEELVSSNIVRLKKLNTILPFWGNMIAGLSSKIELSAKNKTSFSSVAILPSSLYIYFLRHILI